MNIHSHVLKLVSMGNTNQLMKEMECCLVELYRQSKRHLVSGAGML